MSDSETVLVTGASGYIATHVVQQLLEAGYKVKGTVRSLENEEKVKPLTELAGENGTLDLVEADLLKEEGWLDAVKGCSYVLHIASPFPLDQPRNEDDVVKPAVDGTMNVLKACHEAKCVKRVVLTSSNAAVFGNSKNKTGTTVTEEDWTDLTKHVEPYQKSKTQAEKAAWEYVEGLPEDERFELAAVNPCFVMGPALCGTPGTSMKIMQQVNNIT